MRIIGTMKRAVVVTLLVTSMTSCFETIKISGSDLDDLTAGSEDLITESSFVGTWAMSSWLEFSEAEVYISFAYNRTFELYQRVYTSFYEYYYGTWSYSNGELSGTYSDGLGWGAYYVSFVDDMMVLTHSSDENDVSYFVRSTIPDDALQYVNPDSKALDSSETSADRGFFRNSGRFL